MIRQGLWFIYGGLFNVSSTITKVVHVKHFTLDWFLNKGQLQAGFVQKKKSWSCDGYSFDTNVYLVLQAEPG